MSTNTSYRDGGKSSEAGHLRSSTKNYSQVGVIGTSDLLAVAAGTPDNTVKISIGDIVIGSNSPSSTAFPYAYYGWVGAQDSVTISANASGNPRIDVIVAYFDLSVVSSVSNDNPGVIKFSAIVGTASSTPIASTDAVIQAAIGASNPWLPLATVAVANGFSTIVNANIVDCRPLAATAARIETSLSNDLVGSGLLISATSGFATASSSGFALIGGQMVYKPGITHTYTASKDTYVDLSTTTKPTLTDDFTYSEVANGAGSPALGANSIRIAKVITSGAAVTSVTTSGLDSNGLVIRNTSPSVQNFYIEVAANQDMTAGLSDVTGLTITITVPAGGRRLEIKSYVPWQNNTNTDNVAAVAILEDGTVLDTVYTTIPLAGIALTSSISIVNKFATPGVHTYKTQGQKVTGTGTLKMIGAPARAGKIMISMYL